MVGLDEFATVVESKENVSSDGNTPPEQRLGVTNGIYCLLNHDQLARLLCFST